MKEFINTPLGKATLAICLGLLCVAYPPSVALFAAGGALTYGFLQLGRAFRRAEGPITVTVRSRDHDAATTAATTLDLAAGDGGRVSARP